MQAIPEVHLPHFQDVQMMISRGALGGWVEQASPACGAASVAGAWNAIKPEGKQASEMVYQVVTSEVKKNSVHVIRHHCGSLCIPK